MSPTFMSTFPPCMDSAFLNLVPCVALKGIVSLYKGRVLLFLKTFEINRKT